MALLYKDEHFGNWDFDYDLEPVEFWPYTTRVTDIVLLAPRDDFRMMYPCLIRRFQEAGIKAYDDNKVAFGARRPKQDQVWYFGFYDFSFSLGLSVAPDLGLKPLRPVYGPVYP